MKRGESQANRNKRRERLPAIARSEYPSQRILAVSPAGVGVVGDRDRQMVLAMFDLPEKHAHSVERLRLTLQLTPSEARKLAQTLTREAYAAAAGPAQA